MSPSELRRIFQVEEHEEGKKLNKISVYCVVASVLILDRSNVGNIICKVGTFRI